MKDRREYRERLRKRYGDEKAEEKAGDLQLWFQVGKGERRRKKADKRLQFTHGLRKFKTFAKARLFLGLSGDREKYDRPLPRWDRRRDGLCMFEKKATLVSPRTKRGRAAEPEIVKKYEIQEPF